MTDKIIQILNKYQSKAQPLHDDGVVDPMDFHKIAAELEPLINQEVERRIKKRKISRSEIQKEADKLKMSSFSWESEAIAKRAGFVEGTKGAFSRLSQKTEGGGE